MILNIASRIVKVEDHAKDAPRALSFSSLELVWGKKMLSFLDLLSCYQDVVIYKLYEQSSMDAYMILKNLITFY
jgi:hypothetical protein